MGSLRRIARQVDAAVFVFAEDDKVWFRDADLGQPRDNVLIEYGLFLGALGGDEVDRVIFVRVGSPKTASDVAGITYISYEESKKIQFNKQVSAWTELVSPVGIETATAAEVFTSETKSALFLAGEKIVLESNRDLTLCARTPSTNSWN